MIYPVKSSDVLLEITMGGQEKIENGLSWELSVALYLFRKGKCLSYVPAINCLPSFMLHQKGGGITKYYIVGSTSRRILEYAIGELKNLEFQVFIITDLLKIAGVKDIYDYLRIIEDRFGTKRCFSGDFIPVVIERDRLRRASRRI